MTVDERLSRLEKRVAFWRVLSVVLFALLAGVMVSALIQPDVVDELVARRLRLVDEDGFTWLIGGSIDGSERLQIRQKDGPAVVQLRATEQGAGLDITDDRPGGSVVSVSRTWKGHALIYLAGPGRRGMGLGRLDDHFGVRVYDDQAKLIWSAPGP